MKSTAFICLVLLIHSLSCAQTTGGKTAYAFLGLSPSPHLTSLGGINISQLSDDISLVFDNPALLRTSFHTDLSLSYADYLAGVEYNNLIFGFHSTHFNTNLAFGVTFLDYGEMTTTDASGNIDGQFRPNDYVIQVSASRKYLEKWYYGATVKFISSNYYPYTSSAFALDVGVNYLDTAAGFQMAVVAKNMGLPLKAYTTGDPEPLPFDLEAGISKTLAHIPLQLSATFHNIYDFDLKYADPEDEVVGFSSGYSGGFADNFLLHAVFAAELTLAHEVEITTAYNYLVRQELALQERTGASGFSMGVGIILHRIQLRYGRSWYQTGEAFNQLGITLKMDEFMGLGKFGEKIGW